MMPVFVKDIMIILTPSIPDGVQLADARQGTTREGSPRGGAVRPYECRSGRGTIRGNGGIGGGK